ENRNAWWVRQQFKADYKVAPDAVWSFERFGMSRTILADGTQVYISGEHEDFYDPDFYIYNDVILVAPGGQITIYGYPKDIFSPTDFHTATLVNNEIYVIGCMGYVNQRKPGFTPVYRLDCATFRMEMLDTHGDNPGWLSGHEAEFDAAQNAILVAGGQTFEWQEGNQIYRGSDDIYLLDLTTLRWQR
ncbi:MAG TPA: hypothetical protein VKQ72_18535, partial [Aggregatilineales bacterium]|nr:hypothetical protein [Aggregatilineales bacterium]